MSDLLKEIYIKQAQREKAAGTESEKIASLNAAYAQAEKVKKQREINALRQKSADLKVKSINQKVAAAKAQQSAEEKISREQQLQNLNHDFYLSMLEKGIYDPNAAQALGVSETAYKGALAKVQADIAARNAAASGSYIEVEDDTGGDPTKDIKELNETAEQKVRKLLGLKDGVEISEEHKQLYNELAAQTTIGVLANEKSTKPLTNEERAAKRRAMNDDVSGVGQRNLNKSTEKKKQVAQIEKQQAVDTKTATMVYNLNTAIQKHGKDKVLASVVKYVDKSGDTQKTLEKIFDSTINKKQILGTNQRAFLTILRDDSRISEEDRKSISAVLDIDKAYRLKTYQEFLEGLDDEALKKEIEKPSEQFQMSTVVKQGMAQNQLYEKQMEIRDNAVKEFLGDGTESNIKNANETLDMVEAEIKELQNIVPEYDSLQALYFRQVWADKMLELAGTDFDYKKIEKECGAEAHEIAINELRKKHNIMVKYGLTTPAEVYQLQLKREEQRDVINAMNSTGYVSDYKSAIEADAKQVKKWIEEGKKKAGNLTVGYQVDEKGKSYLTMTAGEGVIGTGWRHFKNTGLYALTVALTGGLPGASEVAYNFVSRKANPDLEDNFASYQFNLDDLTEDEKEVLYYFLGRYGDDEQKAHNNDEYSAFAYIDSIADRVMMRKAKEQVSGSAFYENIKRLHDGVAENVNSLALNITKNLSGMQSKYTAPSAYRWEAAKAKHGMDQWYETAAGDVLYAIGDQIPRVVVTAALNYVAPAVGSFANTALFATQTGMRDLNDKIAAGWSTEDALGYTVLNTAFQTVSEKLFNAFGVDEQMGFVTKAFKKQIENVAKKAGGKLILNVFSSFAQEGFEEMIQNVGEQVLNSAFDSEGNLIEDFDLEGMLYDGLIGALTGAAGTSPQVAGFTVDTVRGVAQKQTQRSVMTKNSEELKAEIVAASKIKEVTAHTYDVVYNAAQSGMTLDEARKLAGQINRMSREAGKAKALDGRDINRAYAMGKVDFKTMLDGAARASFESCGLNVSAQNAWIALYNAGYAGETVESFTGLPLPVTAAKAAYEFGKAAQASTEDAEAVAQYEENTEQEQSQDAFVSASAPTGTEAQQGRQQVYDKYNDGSTQYPTAFNKMYLAGKQLGNFDEAYESIKDLLSEQAAREIYDVGNLDRGVAGTTDLKVRKGEGAYRDEGSQIGESVYKELYETVAKLWGIDISTVSDLDGNGKFLPSLVKILISDKTKNELQTLGHELVEYARAFGGEKYTALRDAVIDYYVDKNGRTALDNEIKNYLKAYRKGSDPNTNYEQAEKEFVADFIGGILANEAGLKEFVDQVEQRADLTTAEKRDIIHSLIDLIRKALEKIEEFLGAGQVTGAVRAAAEVEADTARNMIRLLTDALDTSAEAVSKINDGDIVTISGSEGATRNSKSIDDEEKSIRQQLLEHAMELSNMEPVANISNDGIGGKNRRQQLTEIMGFLKNFKIIDRQNFGVIHIIEDDVNRSLNYLSTDNEYASFWAIPRVIKKGKILAWHENHKMRGHPTKTVMAPVIINGRRGNIGVVIKQTGKNRYKTHRIIMVDNIETSNKKETEATSGKMTDVATGESLPITTVSVDTMITRNKNSVNSNSMQKSKNDSKVERKSIDMDAFAKDDETAKEITLLKSYVKDLLEISGGGRKSIPRIRAFAERLVKQYKSTYSAQDLTAELINLYEYIGKQMKGKQTLTQEQQADATERAKAIAKKLIKNRKHRLAQDAKDILAFTRSKTIYFNQDLKKEASYLSDGWGRYLNSVRGLMHITTDKSNANAIPADSFMEELFVMYPVLQTEENYNEMDIPGILQEINRRVRSFVEEDQYDNVDFNELVSYEAERIVGEYGHLPTVGEREADYPYKERRTNLTAELNKAVNKHLSNAEKMSNRYEMRLKQERVEKIDRIVKDFTKRLLRPSERAYVPDAFKADLITLVKSISIVSQRAADSEKLTKSQQSKLRIDEQLDDIAARIEKILKENDDDSIIIGEEKSGLKFDKYQTVAIQKLRDAAKLLKGKDINTSMSLTELNTIYDGLRDFKDMIIAETRMEGERKTKELYAIRAAAGKQIAKAGKRAQRVGGVKGLLWKGRVETLSADSIMKVITGYDENSELWKLWQDIAKYGLRKEQLYRMEAQKFFAHLRADAKSEKLYKAATDSTREWDILDSRGNKVKMSEFTAAALWMTWRREINNEGHIHLQKGGALIPNAEMREKDNPKAAEDNGQLIPKITTEIIDKISDGLSDYTKQWIKVAEIYFNEYSAPKINEMSQERWHRDIATNKYYFPYKVFSKGNLSDVEGMTADATLESTGSLQEVQKNSKKVLTIFSLDDVIDSHISQMSKAVGYMIPIRNFARVWGGLILDKDMLEIDRSRSAGATGISQSLRGIVESHFGEEAVRSIEDTLVELGGKKIGIRSIQQSEKAIEKLTGNVARGIFVANVRVRMKQITSYYAAGSVLSGGALLAGVSANVNNIRYGGAANIDAEADKYTSLLYARRAGMSLANLGDVSEDSNFLTKLGAWNPTRWMQSADVTTARRLWVASKTEISMRYEKSGKASEIGSQKYFEDVADIFEEAVSATQPYHTLHKATIMKSDKQLVRELYRFRTQSFLNASVLYDAYAALKATEPNSEAHKRAAAKLTKVIVSQTVGAIVFVLLDVMAATLLHRLNPFRDDEGELTWKSVGIEAVSRMISGIIELVLPRIGPELYDAIMRAWKGKQYDSFSVSAFDTLNDLFQTFTNGLNLFSPKFTPEQKWQKARAFIADFVEGVGAVIGFPVGNITQIVEAAWYHIEDAMNGEFLSFEAGYDRSGEQQYKRAYDALMEGNQKVYDDAHEDYVQSRSGDLEGLTGDKLAEKQKEIEDAWHSGIREQLKENHAEKFTKAAEDVANGNLNAYLSVIKEFEQKGFDREDVAKTIYSMKSEDDENIISGEVVEGTIYHPQNLYYVVNTPLYDEIYKELYDAKLAAREKKAREEGKTIDAEWMEDARAGVHSDLHEVIRDRLKEESRIETATLDYEAADFGTYRQTVDYYVSKGFDMEDVAKAIRSGSEDKTKLVEGTIYSYRDLLRAAATGYQSEIQSEIYAAKEKAGETKKEIRESIQRSATDYFRPLYDEGTPAERAEIKKKIVALGCYENPYKTIKNWYENPQKKK